MRQVGIRIGKILGDAGAPPSLDITGATGGPIVYPAPERQQDGPFTSYEYTGEILLPVTVTAKSGAGALSIDASASWLVCEKICVPEDAKFHLDIPAGAGTPGAQAPLFAATDARTPRASPFPAHFTPDGKLWFAAPNLALKHAEFFPADAGAIDQGAPQALSVDPERITLSLKPVKSPLTALSGVLSLTDRGGQTEYLDIDATPMALPATAALPAAPGLLRALLLAFAGGLILNLMPCVLPVLAIKALALAKLSGVARAHVRQEAAFYTLGVVAAFCAIGAITFGVRAAGGGVGWGVEFQSAAFTTAMAWLAVPDWPQFVGCFFGGRHAGRGRPGVGPRAAVSSPVCWPLWWPRPARRAFMGAALAAALAMPPAAGMLIFVALGLGLAAPYAALALSPASRALFAQAGRVDGCVQAFAGLPDVWRRAVDGVGCQPADKPVGPRSGVRVAAPGGVCGLGLWLWARCWERPRLLNGAAILAIAASFVLLVRPWHACRAGPLSGQSADGSEPYSAARLAALRAEHRPVLVDMSAAWCVT